MLRETKISHAVRQEKAVVTSGNAILIAVIHTCYEGVHVVRFRLPIVSFLIGFELVTVQGLTGLMGVTVYIFR